MISIVMMIFLILAGVGLTMLKVPDAVSRVKGFASAVLIVLGVGTGVSGSIAYNDMGNCQQIQTIFGTEDATCNTGWYFEGWGHSTRWPHYITVANTDDKTMDASSVTPPYSVRLSDNWNGTVTQTTRFGIPQDRDQFLVMAKVFRSPERLVSTTLKPAVTSSLDSVANLFTMEEYYAGGKRDAFKTEFQDAVLKGRAKVKQVTTYGKQSAIVSNAAPNDFAQSADTSNVGETSRRQIVMEKVLDSSGNVIRERHAYMDYGIIPSTPILENLDPDDKFEDQIQARKDAASRRMVAQEQRKEQEEQRLLEIQRGETEIAKKQAQAKVVQIQRTTDAETEKKLALISADKVRSQAQIAKETSEINLEKARIDAEAVQVHADAEAYKKKVVLEADGALKQKLDAMVQINDKWANAYANRAVPQYVFGSGGGDDGAPNGADTEVSQFMQMMIMKSAKDLQFNPNITK